MKYLMIYPTTWLSPELTDIAVCTGSRTTVSNVNKSNKAKNASSNVQH